MSTTQQLKNRFIKALERDKKKFTKELAEVNSQLAALNGHGAKATVAFADMAHHKVKTHHISAAGRAAISKAAKRRWAKVKAQTKKAAG